MALISQDEAEVFVKRNLGLRDYENRPSDRQVFLNKVIRAFSAEIPFQNVTLLATEPANRKRPSLTEVKEAVFSGVGGLCYTTVVFLKYLLEALGFNVHFIAGSVLSHPDNHLGILLKDLTHQGSTHLADANGYPTFQAIPLDFEEKSPIYNESFFEYKFMRKINEKGQKVILRLHRRGDYYGPEGELFKDGWRTFCEFNLTPRELSHFDAAMEKIYTIPYEGSPFLVGLRVVQFSMQSRMVAIKDKKLLLENEDHAVREFPLKTKEEYLSTVQKYFPQLAEGIVAALSYLKYYTDEEH